MAQRAPLLCLCFAICFGLSSSDPQPRAAGGRGPELRSRITHALDELQRALAADPLNGELWWKLGIQAQVAAGGSVTEEQAAVALLEKGRAVQEDCTAARSPVSISDCLLCSVADPSALSLSPQLTEAYDNAMAIGDMHRGVRNASRARHFYTLAAHANPLSSVQYMYAGLTFELEGNFALAARAFLLASRVQAHHTQGVCRQKTSARRLF